MCEEMLTWNQFAENRPAAGTTQQLAANRERSGKQMAVISERANVRECSRGVRTLRSCRRTTFMLDVSVSGDRVSVEENNEATVAQREAPVKDL